MGNYGFVDAISTPDSGANVGRMLASTIYNYFTPAIRIEKVFEYIKSHKLFKT